ncbi:MAG: RNA pseudouridine synthase [Gammaproteobacteria bacterium]|nr:RNA pseudouridine synthase [Gammaproteobacteria bacterium]|tara:strand:+ start:4343 stop:5242 length:900 start_codon:yes stop_codon:yes gene_type:complete
MQAFNKTQQYKVTQANENQRIDNFLITYMKSAPRKHIYKLIRTGQVRVNSKRIKPFYKLKVEDIIRIPPYIGKELLDVKVDSVQKNNFLKRIIYEDNNLLIFNKPTNLSVHSGSKLGFGLIDIARKVVLKNERIDLLHRLDKETSGCIVLTKNLRTLRKMQDQMKNRAIIKKYICLVFGKWKYKDGIMKTSIVRNKKKHSIETNFEKINEYKNFTLMGVTLITGKYHQIRQHCYKLGHPIVGDKKYKYGRSLPQAKINTINRIFLHSKEIVFKDVDSNKKIKVKSPIPEDLKNFIKEID